MDQQETLPFQDVKQKAFLGHLIIDEHFFLSVQNRVKPGWFLSEDNSKVFKYLLKYREKYGSHPRENELKTYGEVAILEPREKAKIQNHIDACISWTAQIRLGIIIPELTEWLHSTILLGAMKDAERLYNNRNIKQCYEKLQVAVREIQTTNFSKAPDSSFEDLGKFLDEAEGERSQALTTGLSMLDEAILKDTTSGGMQRGDTTLVIAPQNIGKTTFLLSIICHNIAKGVDVLLITHEGRPADIKLNILSNMMRLEIPQVFALYKTKEGRELIQTKVNIINQHLKYVPFHKPGMTVEDVMPIIVIEQEDWMASHQGKGFDLLVDDYPAKLTSEIAKKGNLQTRNINQLVYSYFVQAALEYKFHSLVAMQTNRDGSRVNRNSTGTNRLLVPEDMSEAWITDATNIMTLNRSPSAIVNDLITVHVPKSRGSMAGVSILAKSCYKHHLTHANSLGSVSYVGTRTNNDRIVEIFNRFNGHEIPIEQVRDYSL